MPRRSGTTTVWSRASSAAKGAHMSLVSPNPWSSTTAGPEVNRRTVIRRDLLRAEVAWKRLDLRRSWPREGERPKDTDQHSEHVSSPPMGRVVHTPCRWVGRQGLVELSANTAAEHGCRDHPPRA
jgi:hypothetical protein